MSPDDGRGTGASPRASALAATLVLAWLLPGCTAFAGVRSARVEPGVAVGARASYASPPGEIAGWFWSIYCAHDCNHPVAAVDLDISFGRVPTAEGAGPGPGVGASDTVARSPLHDRSSPDDRHPLPRPRPSAAAGSESAGRPVELGGGINGPSPYVEGYLQIGRGDRPWGIGGRLGIPLLTGWGASALYARVDIPRAGDGAILLNPTLFLHAGRSPNGQNRGMFLGFAPAVGYRLPGRGSVRVILAAQPVLGQSWRERYGETESAFRVFGALSGAIRLRVGDG